MRTLEKSVRALVVPALVAVFGIGCGGVAAESELIELGETDQALKATVKCPIVPTVQVANLANGIKMEYAKYGDAGGVPVILLHGYSVSRRSFDLNVQALAARYKVYVPDLRGHGNSSKPACCYAQSDFAGDVVQFMNAIGITKASLIGHSMGSFVAEKVALDSPTRVHKLVLIGSAATVAGNPVALYLQSVVNTLTDPIDATFVSSFEQSVFELPVPADYMNVLVNEAFKVPVNVWKLGLAGLIAEDHSHRLGSIAAPTLILHGSDDVFFTASEQEELDLVIPNSTLISYAGAGHGLHAELPTQVAADIVTFLN